MNSNRSGNNEYPAVYGYTPSLYNEEDVIDEESSNYEDSQLVSDQSFGVEDQLEGYDSNIPNEPVSDYDGPNEQFSSRTPRDRAYAFSTGNGFESLDDFTSVEQDFIPPQFSKTETRSRHEPEHVGSVGFNAETNLYEGGLEIGQLDDDEYETEYIEEDDEMSFPSHDNISYGNTNDRQITTVSSAVADTNGGVTEGLGWDTNQGDDSMNQPFSGRFRQDTLDEISSASEDFYEEDLNEEHNAHQVVVQNSKSQQSHSSKDSAQSQPHATQRVNGRLIPSERSPAGHTMSSVNQSREESAGDLRSTNRTPQNGASVPLVKVFDTALDSNEGQDYYEDDTSHLLSSELVSHTFPNREYSQSQDHNRHSQVSPGFSRYRGDTLESEMGINLYSRNLRQPSMNADFDRFLREDSVMSADTHPTMPVLFEDTSVAGTDRSSLSKGPSRNRNRLSPNRRQSAIASVSSSPPNWNTRASDSEGEISVAEDASKHQLYDKLRKEKFHSSKLKDENKAYQQQVNDLNVQLANTRDILDQLRVKAHIGLDVHHPDAPPNQGAFVNPTKQPMKFEMPKPGRAGVIDAQNNNDSDATPRLNELFGEAQRINNSLDSFCGIIRDGKMHASQHRNFLQRIKREAQQLRADSDNLVAEMNGMINPEEKQLLDQLLFQIDFLIEDADHLFEEIESQKQAQIERMERERQEAELAKSKSNLDLLSPADTVKPFLEQNEEVVKLAQQVEQLKAMYEYERQRNNQSERGPGQRKLVEDDVINGPHVQQQLESATQPGLNIPLGFSDGHEGEDWHYDGANENEFDENEDFYNQNVDNLGSVFKPISTQNSSMITGSVDPRAYSNQDTPVNYEKSPATVAKERTQMYPQDSDENLNTGAQRRNSDQSGFSKRRSSIPKLDQKHYQQSGILAYPRNNSSVSNNNRPAFVEQRFLKGRTHFSDRPVQKTYSVDSESAGESGSYLNRRPRLAAGLEDNDSGFVGSGPSHFGNLTSETSYASSRGQTPAAAATSLRRNQNPTFDRRSSEHFVDPKGLVVDISGLKPGAENSEASSDQQNNDDLESLGLESPNSSVGSVKKRPTNSSHKPKSTSTPKPSMNSAGVQARANASNKNSQTQRQQAADAAIGDGVDLDSGYYRNRSQTIPSSSNAKFASHRSGAFKPYATTSSDENLPLTNQKESPAASSSFVRRSSNVRKHLPFSSRRGVIDSTQILSSKPKVSPVASASKFSKSESALETSLQNQSKIDEIEKEITALKAQIDVAKEKTVTRRHSIMSTSPRTEGDSPAGAKNPARGEARERSSVDEGIGLSNETNATYTRPRLIPRSESLRKLENRSSSHSDVHSCIRKNSASDVIVRKSAATNTFEALPSRGTKSKKLQTEELRQQMPSSGSESDDLDNRTLSQSRGTQLVKRGGDWGRSSLRPKGRADVMSSDLDSAFDIIKRHKPRRTSSARVKSVGVETDDRAYLDRANNQSLMNDSNGIQTQNANLAATVPTSFVTTTNQMCLSPSAVAYLPFVGLNVAMVQQPLHATIPHLIAPATTLLPQTTGIWMYNQQTAGLPLAPMTPLLAAGAQQIVPETMASRNPVRFYYKTGRDVLGDDGADRYVSRSMDGLDHKGRKYDVTGNRVRTYKKSSSGNNSQLLASVQKADMAAKQLKRLSQNMASSVYTHLNSGDLI